MPVGDYAREALANAGIADEAEANVVSNEEDNASVVAKIAAGEGDAGIVYESDISAAAGNDVAAVDDPRRRERDRHLPDRRRRRARRTPTSPRRS